MKTKEIKLGVRTEAHDVGVKVKAIQGFLAKGDRCKVVIAMKGREQAHPDIAHDVLAKIVDEVGAIGKPMAPTKREGRFVHVTLTPSRPVNRPRPDPRKC